MNDSANFHNICDDTPRCANPECDLISGVLGGDWRQPKDCSRDAEFEATCGRSACRAAVLA